MPPDAAMQQAALQQIDRKIDQEEVARAQYDREHAKSDAILKAKSAIAGYDGTPRDRSGKASGVVGSHDRGAMEMGLHKKSDKVKGAKTTKEAAKWSKELAAESKTNQTGGDGANIEAANEPPSPTAAPAPVVEAAPGPAGGGGTGGGSATATTTGTASGATTQTAGETLTSAPPSIFSDAIDTAGKDLADEGKKEVAAKQEALPDFKAKIEAPDPAAETAIDTSPADRGLNQGGTGDNASAPTLARSAPKKLKKKKPGQDMAGAQAETPPDVLAHLFADSLAKIDTEATTNTNPGPAPTVKFQGSSDPGRAGRETAEADTKIAEANASTKAAIAARPGTDEIQPITIDHEVTPPTVEMPDVPEVAVDAGMAEYEAKMEEHGQAVGDAADSIQGAEFDAKLNEAQAAIDAGVAERDTDYAAKVDEAAKEVDDLNAKAAEDQDKQVADARAKVESEHESTRRKQDQELGKAKGKSDKAKKDAEAKIESRRKDDDKKIAKKYKDADRQAKAEKRKAEAKAKAEKQKAEAKKSDQGWFSSMASAISSFVDGIASAVTKVFDTLASTVSGILNAVKDAATSMIDAAINFATSTLDSLGGMLKGLVDNLIGDVFPGLAAALNDAIDSAVETAKNAVTAIGEQLKNGVAAAVDGLNAGIQAVINAYKAAVTAALAVASAVVSGDWEKALLVLLEGALSLAGIDKSQFYGLVGQGTDTIKSIVDDPGAFIGNLIDAVGQGFGNFAGNFGTHLMTGAVEWLTGSLGEAGITLPDTWDAMGIFGLVMDVMGLSADKLKDKVGEKIGEENVAMLETAWGYVDATIQGGLTGLWEHVQGQLSGLWDGLIDAALGFLMEKVVTAAVTKIASMFSPVGAIVQAILTAWNVYQFVQEQAQRIMSLVTSVVSSMAEIVAGQLGPAANMIEGALADLVPVAISLLANLLGLGGISDKVKEIVEGLQGTVNTGIDFALDKLIELGRGAFDAIAGTTRDEASVPGSAPPSAQEALQTAQFPETTTFSDSSGHAHRLWAESANGDGKMMVASTVRTVPEQIALWENAANGLRDTDPAKPEALVRVNTIKSLQAEADQLSDQIASSGGDPAALKAKQEAMKVPMDHLFSFMAENGIMLGMRPEDTIGTPNHLEFKRRYEKLESDLGVSIEKSADDLWLQTVTLIQDTQTTFDSLRKVNPGERKVMLSEKSALELNREFDPLLAAIQPSIDEWVKQNASKKWAFWGGQPGQQVACSAPGVNALESSAIGSLFDGININGRWNIQLWTALSEHYAKTLANNITDKMEFVGFVGVGSTGIETIYNQVESRAVAKIMGHNRRADVTKMFKWYAVVCADPGPGKEPDNSVPDTTKSVDGFQGAFFTGSRADCIAQAETENRKVLGWPAEDHRNLHEQLIANEGAAKTLESNFQSVIENANAPERGRDKKLPELESYLFHHRPTLESLFVKNSNVGKALVDDLKKVKKTVTGDGITEQRGFEDGSPYLDLLKDEVKNGDLKTSVRSSTIKGGVLAGASPIVPGDAATAIGAWLEGLPAHGTGPSTRSVDQLPRHRITNAAGQSEELFVDTDHVVKQKGSGDAKAVAMTHENSAVSLAEEIKKLTGDYIAAKNEPQGLLETIKQKLALLKTEMVAARGEMDDNAKIAARLDLEQKLGMYAFTAGPATEAAGALADKSWALLEGLGNQMLEDARKTDDKLKSTTVDAYEPFRDLVRETGMNLGDGWFGAVGKHFQTIKLVFQSGNLREKIQHSANFSEIWAKKVYELEAKTVAEVMKNADVVWDDIKAVLTLRAEGRVAKEMAVDPKKYSLGKKTLFASDLDNEEYTQAKKSSPDEKFPTVPLRALEGDHLKALARKHGLTFSENPTEDELIAIITAHQEKLVAEKKVWNWKWIVPGTTGKGESNPMCLSDRDDSVFIAMTDRENKAHGLDGKLPFLEGMMANMVDTRSAWIQRARELEMPLRAGPSGTTFRTMNYAAQLGGINLPGMRLGMLGHLIPTNAHSYHEVMVAAQGHVPYLGQGKYSPLDPVPDAEMRRMAKEAAGGVEERVDPILGINE